MSTCRLESRSIICGRVTSSPQNGLPHPRHECVPHERLLGSIRSRSSENEDDDKDEEEDDEDEDADWKAARREAMEVLGLAVDLASVDEDDGERRDEAAPPLSTSACATRQSHMAPELMCQFLTLVLGIERE